MERRPGNRSVHSSFTNLATAPGARTEQQLFTFRTSQTRSIRTSSTTCFSVVGGRLGRLVEPLLTAQSNSLPSVVATDPGIRQGSAQVQGESFSHAWAACFRWGIEVVLPTPAMLP
jgi:hypothetical protein